MRVRVVAATLLGLLVAQSASAAWAYKQVAFGFEAGSDASHTAVMSSLTTETLLTACVAWDNGGTATPPALTDTIGNTWTQIPTESPRTQAGFTLAMYYAINAGSGANTVTATWGASVSSKLIIVDGYDGTATSSVLDKAKGQTQTGPTGSDALSSGTTASTTTSPQLAVGCGYVRDGSNAPALGVGTGFTERLEKSADVTTFYSVSIEDKNLAATGTTAATWTQVGSGDSAAIVATFKEPAAGGGSSRCTLLGVCP